MLNYKRVQCCVAAGLRTTSRVVADRPGKAPNGGAGVYTQQQYVYFDRQWRFAVQPP